MLHFHPHKQKEKPQAENALGWENIVKIALSMVSNGTIQGFTVYTVTKCFVNPEETAINNVYRKRKGFRSYLSDKIPRAELSLSLRLSLESLSILLHMQAGVEYLSPHKDALSHFNPCR